MQKSPLLIGIAAVLAGAVILAACGGLPGAGTEEGPAPLHTWTPVPTAEPGVVLVDPGVELGPISPYVYGVNHGPWAGVPFEYLEQSLAAGITYIRFPGGNHGDMHNLRELQIDQFIKMARQYKAEPSISVRLKGGTVEAAVEAVRYTNVENDYGVRYWSIGNEPNLFGDGYDTERYNREWREYAEAMLEVDPDIILVGPDINTYLAIPEANPKDDAGIDWMESFLKANGDLVDIVSFHRYPFPKTMNAAPPTPEELLASAQEYDTTVPYLRQQIRDLTGRDIPVAVTEVNSNWAKASGLETSPDSYLNAVWWADALGRLIRQQVEIVAFFSLQSSPQIGTYGLFGSTEVRPVYQVYPLYRMFGSTLVQATSGVEKVSAYAARRDDGALTIVLINLAPEEQAVPLRIAGAGSGAAQVWRFEPDQELRQIADQPLGAEQEIRLPGYSVSLYVIP